MLLEPHIPDAATLDRLSERERVVLRLVGRGYQDHEIAEALVRRVTTTKTHVQRIMEKLGTRRRTVLVLFAVRVGLVEV